MSLVWNLLLAGKKRCVKVAFLPGIALPLLFCLPGTSLAQQADPRPELKSISTAIRTLANRAMPSVVEVVVQGYIADEEDLSHPIAQFSRQRSSGSGVVVDPAGFIITNAHVVRGATGIDVLLPSESTSKLEVAPKIAVRTFPGRVLGIDETSDLALLKIEADHLPALKFGNMESLNQGDLVLAIGSPLGLRNSLSVGVVSASRRAVSDENPILYIQTDASINPGNSGGALLDTNGDLAGINTFIASQSGGNEGIGFAIPSDVVANVYRQLRSKGKVTRGTIGLFLQNITPVMAAGLGLPSSSGVVVSDVQPDGPSDRVGLKRRDIVLKVGGKPVTSARDFVTDLLWRPAGQRITLTVQRAERTMIFEPEVMGQSESASPLGGLTSPERNLIRKLGIFCVEIDKDIAAINPDLRRQYGLIVAAKTNGGEAHVGDLHSSDIIHAVNNLPISSLDAFRKRIDEFKPGDPVVLQIERDGRFRYVSFSME